MNYLNKNFIEELDEVLMGIYKIPDNGDRRTASDRRQFLYTVHIPERRSGIDRRSGVDRRASPLNYRGDKERRRIFQ